MSALSDVAIRRAIACEPEINAWRVPESFPVLGDADVHVWIASVNAHLSYEWELRELLSGDERSRAERFQVPQDRTRFVVAHGIARALLARYLGRHPAVLRFAPVQNGKPKLIDVDGSSPLAFNLSQSADLVALAVGRRRAVGVDIERWGSEAEREELADLLFSRSERETFRALPTEHRLRGFFDCWTRKEAYIKATGFGVARGLDHFDVTFTPGAPARLLADRLAPEEPERWTLRDLEPGPGYSGAVIAEGVDWRLDRLVLTTGVLTEIARAG